MVKRREEAQKGWGLKNLAKLLEENRKGVHRGHAEEEVEEREFGEEADDEEEEEDSSEQQHYTEEEKEEQEEKEMELETKEEEMVNNNAASRPPTPFQTEPLTPPPSPVEVTGQDDIDGWLATSMIKAVKSAVLHLLNEALRKYRVENLLRMSGRPSESERASVLGAPGGLVLHGPFSPPDEDPLHPPFDSCHPVPAPPTPHGGERSTSIPRVEASSRICIIMDAVTNEGFYVTLPSNASKEVFKDNTSSSFTVDLAQAIELKGKCMVGDEPQPVVIQRFGNGGHYDKPKDLLGQLVPFLKKYDPTAQASYNPVRDQTH
ncbi:hypothetical protein L3Q82_000497 [Scortum barcoo]|uniref:Uncharacterized protein n=1 Tax=Scortum barcoo TaxID=214431 RepID=A0ACB8WER6_9TELE|nr:hypothetical protein L3Q82_000497 [Scortum barcoo]